MSRPAPSPSLPTWPSLCQLAGRKLCGAGPSPQEQAAEGLLGSPWGLGRGGAPGCYGIRGNGGKGLPQSWLRELTVPFLLLPPPPVIPDQLSVSAAPPSSAKPPFQGRGAKAAPPPQMVLLESQDLLLTCSVASGTQQHTHLSVAFTVSAPGSPRLQQEVIGLQRDFALEAAGRFAPRRLARELSLVKLGDWRYQMALGRLKPEDSGTYHCTAGEWIQDPDGSWQQITEKRVTLADVSVQSIGGFAPPQTPLYILGRLMEPPFHISRGGTVSLQRDLLGVPHNLLSQNWHQPSPSWQRLSLRSALPVGP